MSTIDQQARIELSLNAQKATDKLNELTKEAAKLNQKLKETEKGTKEYDKLEKKLNSVEKNMKKAKAAAFDVNKVLDNLSGASMKDLNKAIKEMNRQMQTMDRNSDKWKYYSQQVRRAKAELESINAESKKSESWLSRLNGRFNKWGAGIAAVAASVTGLTLTVQKFRQMAMEKESSQANLKALTGLDDQSIAWLTEQAEQLSTTMEKSGLRVRKTSQEILDAYTLVGSAKPELLSNKEALNAVTIEAMRLAEAARMDLTQAVDAVTLSMNQYGASADEAARYTNVMAAGSKFGSAAVQSVTTAVQKAGVAASTAGIPIEALVGSIETLAEKGIKDEVAGTGLKTFFLKLEGMSEDVRPSVVGLQTALENLQAKQMDSVEMQKAFGLEAYTVAQAMIDGADKVKYYTEAVTGTNVAVEQAAINSNTAEARMAQARNQIREVGIELGQRLSPLVISTTRYTTLMMQAFMTIIDTCAKYKTTLIALVSAITAVTIAAKADIVVKKLTVLWNDKIVESLNRMWKAMMKNPIAALVVVFTTLVSVFVNFLRESNETKKRLQELNNTINDINKTSNQNIQNEKEKLNSLLSIAKDELRSKQDRVAAIKELNALSPEYLGNLSLENINTTKATEAVQAYVDNLLTLERVKQATFKREELRSKLQEKLNEFYQTDRGAYWAKKYGALDADQVGNMNNWKAHNVAGYEQVFKELLMKNKEAYALYKALFETNQIIVKGSKDMVENMIKGRIVSDTPTVVTGTEEDETTATDIIEAQEREIEKLAHSRLVIEQLAYYQGEKSLEEHMKAMHDIENAAILAKQVLYIGDLDKINELELEKLKNTMEYEEKIKNIKIRKEQEAEQFRTKYIQLSAEEKMQNELDVLEYMYQQELFTVEQYEQLKAAIKDKFTKDKEKEVAQFKAKYIQASAEEEMQTELDKLENMYERKLMSEEEYQKLKLAIQEKYAQKQSKSILDFSNWDSKTMEEKLKQISEIAESAWSQISALMNAGSELMQANMDLEIAKINQRYDVQLQRAEGNEEETKKLEEKKEAEIARVKNEYNKRQMKMQMAQLMATSAIGILNAWVAAMKIEPPYLIPIFGGILTGIITAQTAIQAAALKKQHEAQAAGYYSGGYTSRTLRDTDPAGIVHGNEFVVNARAVRNPAIRPMLDFIDTAQRNNYISSITSSDVARAAGAVPATTTVINNNSDSETLAQVVAVVAKLSKQLDQPIVAQTYVTGKGGSLEANKLYDKMISNATK